MGFFEPSVMGGGGGHEGFVVITLMIMKFGTSVKLDVFYTMVTKKFVTSRLLHHYDIHIRFRIRLDRVSRQM